jgi:hypothetical protein
MEYRPACTKYLNNTLFLEVLICFTIIDIALVVFEFLHGLLFKNLMSTFLLQFFGDFGQ